MQIKTNQIKKLSILLIVCTIISWPETGRAFEPWTGKTTANVNLRKSPELNGKIIAGIEKGKIGLIKDENGNWYQIMVEYDTYGYKGWIYGKYLHKLNTRESGSGYPLNEAGTRLEPIEKSLENLASPQRRSPVTNIRKTQRKEKEMPAPLFEETPSGGISEKEENRPASIDEPQEVEHSSESVSPENVGKRKIPLAKTSGGFNRYKDLSSFPGLILILSSITLSGFTLLFFFRSTALAKTNHDLTIQLQRIKNKFAGKKPRVKERRLHPRTLRLVQVDFVVQDRAYWGFIYNVSDCGAYIETREAFSVGQKMVLTFPSPNREGHIKTAGEVVRTDPEGIGVKFEKNINSTRITPGEGVDSCQTNRVLRHRL